MGINGNSNEKLDEYTINRLNKDIEILELKIKKAKLEMELSEYKPKTILNTK